MIIRRATESDIPEAYPLVIRGLNPDNEPLLFSDYKLRDEMREAVRPNNYALVAEKDGKVVAYLGAVVQEMRSFERCQATVVAFYSETTWAGYRMMKEFMRWADDDVRIKRVMVFPGVDGAEKLLRRINKNFKKVPAFACVV